MEKKLNNVVQVSTIDVWFKSEFQTNNKLSQAALPNRELERYYCDVEHLWALAQGDHLHGM